jgi:hypothetical protein
LSEFDERLATPEDEAGPPDNYPNLADSIDLVVEAEDFPQGEVERFEMFLHASGEVTWRAWLPRADEPVGGYIPAS